MLLRRLPQIRSAVSHRIASAWTIPFDVHLFPERSQCASLKACGNVNDQVRQWIADLAASQRLPFFVNKMHDLFDRCVRDYFSAGGDDRANGVVVRRGVAVADRRRGDRMEVRGLDR